MKVSTFQILAHHLADDGAPGAVLLPVAVVPDARELLEIVFHERTERAGFRVTRLINGCRCSLHALHNSQLRISERVCRLRRQIEFEDKFYLQHSCINNILALEILMFGSMP